MDEELSSCGDVCRPAPVSLADTNERRVGHAGRPRNLSVLEFQRRRNKFVSRNETLEDATSQSLDVEPLVGP